MGGFSIVFLMLSSVIGVIIAYYNNGWWTLFGPSIGLLTAWFYEAFGLWILPYISGMNWGLSKKRKRRIYKIFKRVCYFLAFLFVFEKDKKIETYCTILEITNLSQFLIQHTFLNLKSCAQRLVLTSLGYSPPFYLRWFIVGLLIAEIRPSLLQHEITPALDFYLGTCFAVTMFLELLKNSERNAISEVEKKLPSILSNDIIQICDKVDTRSTSNNELVSLIRDLRLAEFNLGRFTGNSITIIGSIYSLCIVLTILFLISKIGAIIAFASCSFVLPAMIFANWSSQKEAKDLAYLRVRKNTLLKIFEDPRVYYHIRKISPKGAFVSQIDSLRHALVSGNSESESDHTFIKKVGMLIFFSLFGVSTLIPVVEIGQGYLSTRLVILYVFSMMSLWYAIGKIADRYSQITKSFVELEKAKIAVRYIKKYRNKVFESGNNNSSLPTSGEIIVSEFTFNFPFQETCLENIHPFTIPDELAPNQNNQTTAGTVVRVFGDDDGILLRLLAGNLKPSSGTVKIGNHLVENMASNIYYIPDCGTQYQEGKVIEIVEAWLGGKLVDTVGENGDKISKATIVNRLLSRFCLSELSIKGREKHTGANLILGYNNIFLSPNQNRLFLYANWYASAMYQFRERNIKLVVVDGIHRLEKLNQRIKVARNFKELADKHGATLIASAKDSREMGSLLNDADREFVLCCRGLEDRALDQNTKEVETLVTFGIYGDLRNHTNKRVRDKLNEFLSPNHPRN